MRDAKNNEDFVPLPTVRLDARRTDVIRGKGKHSLVNAPTIQFDQIRPLM